MQDRLWKGIALVDEVEAVLQVTLAIELLTRRTPLRYKGSSYQEIPQLTKGIVRECVEVNRKLSS